METRKLLEWSGIGSLGGRTVLLISLVLLQAILISHGGVEAGRPGKRDTKSTGRSLQTEDGDVIECIMINKQPAFDHPALRNHTIQMKPTVFPTGFEPGEKASASPLHERKMLQRIPKCPGGTIPKLRHPTLAATARGGRLANFNAYNYSVDSASESSKPTDGHEYAVASAPSGQYYGAKAVINVWNPTVEGAKEFSLSQIWITAGGYETNDLNTVEAGWMVHPALYGDSKTRLFIYWTNNGYKDGSGCYNMDCSGFVQTSTQVALGVAFEPVSTIGGEQHDLNISIFKDKSSGNWWLMIQEVAVGYWPGSLFTTLSESATGVQWGGEVVNDKTGMRHTKTEMGSGRFPSEGTGKASYFNHLSIVDASNTYMDPPPGITKIVTNSKCYDIEIGTNDAGTEAGRGSYYLYYGGPGGLSPDCL